MARLLREWPQQATKIADTGIAVALEDRRVVGNIESWTQESVPECQAFPTQLRGCRKIRDTEVICPDRRCNAVGKFIFDDYVPIVLQLSNHK